MILPNFKWSDYLASNVISYAAEILFVQFGFFYVIYLIIYKPLTSISGLVM